eukprot:1333701-Rhodomonas_salina.1
MPLIQTRAPRVGSTRRLKTRCEIARPNTETHFRSADCTRKQRALVCGCTRSSLRFHNLGFDFTSRTLISQCL